MVSKNTKHTHKKKTKKKNTTMQRCFLLQFFFVCASVVMYVEFIVSIFVPFSSFSAWKGCACDCSLSWVHHLYFLPSDGQLDRRRDGQTEEMGKNKILVIYMEC